MKDFSVIIVNKTGEGMKSSLPTAFHKICGKEIFKITADAMVTAGCAQIVMVGEKEIDGFTCVKTADECQAVVKNECVVVLSGNSFIQDAETIEKILQENKIEYSKLFSTFR